MAKKETPFEKIKRLIASQDTIRNIATSAHIHHGKCIAENSRIMLSDGSIKTAREIFEDASKHVTDVELNDERLKNLTGRLENLLEQNKEIARGLILLEQYIRSKTPEVPRTQFSQQVPEFKL